jgi:SAM-dependent methyltransferase
MVRLLQMTPRSGHDVDWDREWRAAWKAHPANPWFGYQADVYADWARRRLIRIPSRARRMLKTDAFDEACRFHPLDEAFAGVRPVLMDISPLVLGEARSASGAEMIGAVTDVRCLAFRSGSFDLVFSPSTLDHFSDERDIAEALRELHRVLAPGGRLLVTLDNPANPIVGARRAIYRLTGPLGGVIPFAMGRTLSRARLVTLLNREGFEVLDSAYLVHAPRFLGLWLGELTARAGRGRLGARLRAVLRRVEWLAARLPSRRWSGHFVAADCRPAGYLVTNAGLQSVGRYRRLEHRLRCAYLGTVPAPILTRLDPPLRAAAAVVRRTLAVPLYLRQELAEWVGTSGGEPVRVMTWGKRGERRMLFDILFDAVPAPRWLGPASIANVGRAAAELSGDADMLIAETTPALGLILRRRGFLIVPSQVRFGGSPGDLLAAQVAADESLRSDLRRVRRTGYRIELWPYTPANCVTLYDGYVRPHAQARFAEDASAPSFDALERLFRVGQVVAILAPGAIEPDVLCLTLVRGQTMFVVVLGTRGGDLGVVRAGGLAALYDFVIRSAHERGLRWIDLGRSRPWRKDGVAHFKWKWGYRPMRDYTTTLDYAVKILRPASAAARRLTEQQVIVRDGHQFLVMSRQGLVAADRFTSRSEPGAGHG